MTKVITTINEMQSIVKQHQREGKTIDSFRLWELYMMVI